MEGRLFFTHPSEADRFGAWAMGEGVRTRVSGDCVQITPPPSGVAVSCATTPGALSIVLVSPRSGSLVAFEVSPGSSLSFFED